MPNFTPFIYDLAALTACITSGSIYTQKRMHFWKNNPKDCISRFFCLATNITQTIRQLQIVIYAYFIFCYCFARLFSSIDFNTTIDNKMSELKNILTKEWIRPADQR